MAHKNPSPAAFVAGLALIAFACIIGIIAADGPGDVPKPTAAGRPTPMPPLDLPEGLRHVPADALAFVHIRAGEVFATPLGQLVKMELDREGLIDEAGLSEKIGYKLADLESLSFVMLLDWKEDGTLQAEPPMRKTRPAPYYDDPYWDRRPRTSAALPIYTRPVFPSTLPPTRPTPPPTRAFPSATRPATLAPTKPAFGTSPVPRPTLPATRPGALPPGQDDLLVARPPDWEYWDGWDDPPRKLDDRRVGHAPLVISLITPKKPYDRAALVKRFLLAQEAAHGFPEDFRNQIHFVSDRTFALGDPLALRRYMRRQGMGGLHTGPLRPALAAAGKDTLVAAAAQLPEAIAAEVQNLFPPAYQTIIYPLTQVDYAAAFLDSGSTTQLRCEFGFPSKEKAALGHESARTGIVFLQEALSRTFALAEKRKELPAFTRLLREMTAGLPKASLELKDTTLKATVAIDAKLSDQKAVLEDLRKDAEEQALRAQTASKLNQLAMAMHNFHNDYGHLPTEFLQGPKGRVGLSWRVQILPYLGRDERTLYDSFRKDEPWDSPHNIKLLEKMPQLFAHPSRKDLKPGHTPFIAFTGKNCPISSMGTNLDQIALSDGASMTMLAAEAAEGIPWTKPDPEYKPKEALPKLGSPNERGFHAAFCDRSVRFIKSSLPENELRAMITHDDGQAVSLGKHKEWTSGQGFFLRFIDLFGEALLGETGELAPRRLEMYKRLLPERFDSLRIENVALLLASDFYKRMFAVEPQVANRFDEGLPDGLARDEIRLMASVSGQGSHYVIFELKKPVVAAHLKALSNPGFKAVRIGSAVLYEDPAEFDRKSFAIVDNTWLIAGEKKSLRIVLERGRTAAALPPEIIDALRRIETSVEVNVQFRDDPFGDEGVQSRVGHTTFTRTHVVSVQTIQYGNEEQAKRGAAEMRDRYAKLAGTPFGESTQVEQNGQTVTVRSNVEFEKLLQNLRRPREEP